MKPSFLAIALFFLTITAKAQSLQLNGHSEALNVCTSMSSSADQSDCMKQIQNKNFDFNAVAVCSNLSYSSDKKKCLAAIADREFDSSVTGICDSLSFASDKISCLSTIADKTFTDSSEIGLCKGQSFASDIIKCLGNASFTGRYNPPVVSQNVVLIQQIKTIQSLLAQGQVRRALATLLSMQNQICSNDPLLINTAICK